MDLLSAVDPHRSLRQQLLLLCHRASDAGKKLAKAAVLGGVSPAGPAHEQVGRALLPSLAPPKRERFLHLCPCYPAGTLRKRDGAPRALGLIALAVGPEAVQRCSGAAGDEGRRRGLPGVGGCCGARAGQRVELLWPAGGPAAAPGQRHYPSLLTLRACTGRRCHGRRRARGGEGGAGARCRRHRTLEVLRAPSPFPRSRAEPPRDARC